MAEFDDSPSSRDWDDKELLYYVVIPFIAITTIFAASWFLKTQIYLEFSIDSYLVWHNICEFGSVVVSLSIFLLNWYSYGQTGNRRVLFLGVAFLIVGVVDFMHALSFPGMPAFISENSTDKAIDYWITARLAQALALAYSGFISTRHKRNPSFQALLGIGALTVIALTFYMITYLPDLLPAMFVPGKGLTLTKIWLEYSVVFITLIAIVRYAQIYWQTRSHESRILLLGMTLFMFSELFFTLYASAFDTFNLLGHIYKVGAMASIFVAFFVSGVKEPLIERKEANQEINLLLKLTQEIGETSGFNKAINLVLREVCKATQWEYGEAWTFSRDSMVLEYAGGWNNDNSEKVEKFIRVSEEFTFRKDEGLPGRVWSTGSFEWIRDVSVEEESFFLRAKIAAKTDMKAALGIPILADNNLIAVLVFFMSKRQPEDKRLVDIVSGVAAQIGGEIERKRLEEQIKRQIQRVDALREIDSAIIGSFNLNLALNVVLEQVIGQLNVDAAAVLLLGPNQNLTYAAHSGFKSDELVKTAKIRLGSSYAGLSALELRFVNLDDLDESRVPTEFTELLSSEGFSAYFAVPLSAKGQTLGVLEAYKRAPFSADEDWKEFFETIGQQAAIAINSAQLFSGINKAKTELEIAYEATLEGWVQAIDLRDKETEGHTRRVSEMALRLAKVIGIADEKLVHIGRGALLHDIGKISIPDKILHKPGKLTEDEWEIMHKHPVYAHDMLSKISFLEPALEIPHYHHEKWDGTGYPRGLNGKEIPLCARIFAVVDVWDALKSDRPYRKAWSNEKTLSYIKDQSGTHFDPEIVKEFLILIRRED